MTFRPAAFVASVAVFVGFVASACSSDDGGSGTPAGDYAPDGNGVAMDEADACKAITGAEDARRGALSCGPVTRPPCPTYIAAGKPACSQYDQGTVQACVDFILTLSCNELKTRKCIVKALPGTAPAGCPIVDAGPDAEQDSGQDADIDAGADAADDAPADAPGESAADASDDSMVEAGDDGSTDAATD